MIGEARSFKTLGQPCYSIAISTTKIHRSNCKVFLEFEPIGKEETHELLGTHWNCKIQS